MKAFGRFAWWVFAATAFLLLLGQRGLNEPDEGRYAEIAREMTVGGEWLTPHLNGHPHFQKPPVIYWLTAASLSVFGMNEWAARLPSAVAALGTVTLTFGLALRLWRDRDRAVMAALVLTSMAGFFALSRLLTPDMTLTFWITAAISTALHERGGLFFLCLGLGFLTKGPMAFVVPICAVAGWQIGASPERKLKLNWWLGLPMALAVSLSWFIVLSVKHPELFDYFWKYELVDRFGSSKHGRSKPFWFFLAILPVALLPWLFFLPFRRVWERIRERRFTPAQTLLVAWIVIPFLLLSISGSKLPTYILPLLPACALGFSAMLADLRQAWRVALASVAVLVILDTVVARQNDHLGAQASMKPLAQVLKDKVPNWEAGTLFACEARTPGFAFYTGRPLCLTRAQADIVLPPKQGAEPALYRSVADCIEQLQDGPPAFGIVTRERYLKSFDPVRWPVLGSAGKFHLITNQGKN